MHSGRCSHAWSHPWDTHPVRSSQWYVHLYVTPPPPPQNPRQKWQLARTAKPASVDKKSFFCYPISPKAKVQKEILNLKSLNLNTAYCRQLLKKMLPMNQLCWHERERERHMTSGFSSYSTVNLLVTILKQQIEHQSIIIITWWIGYRIHLGHSLSHSIPDQVGCSSSHPRRAWGWDEPEDVRMQQQWLPHIAVPWTEAWSQALWSP
jgi:hypothetical protein